MRVVVNLGRCIWSIEPINNRGKCKCRATWMNFVLGMKIFADKDVVLKGRRKKRKGCSREEAEEEKRKGGTNSQERTGVAFGCEKMEDRRRKSKKTRGIYRGKKRKENEGAGRKTTEGAVCCAGGPCPAFCLREP